MPLEDLPHATIHPGPNPTIRVGLRSQPNFNLGFRMDDNFVIIFKRGGAKPDETPAHSLIKGTSTTNLPPVTKTFVIVDGHDSPEGAR